MHVFNKLARLIQGSFKKNKGKNSLKCYIYNRNFPIEN